MVVAFSWDGVVVRSEKLAAPDCKLNVEVQSNNAGAGDLGPHQICARVSGASAVLICRPFLLIPPCSQTDTTPPCFIGGMGGEPTLTPQQKEALLIMADIGSLQGGVFAIWLPKSAKQGETIKVTLRLGSSESAPFVGGATSPPSEQGTVSKIGNIVSAQLSPATDPRAVDIQGETGTQAERTISGTQFATWNWFVRPTKAGTLLLHVDVRVRLAGLPPEVPPISFALGQDRGVDVQHSAGFEVARGVGNVTTFNWASIAALFTVIAGIAGAITWFAKRGRPAAPSPGETSSPEPALPQRGRTSGRSSRRKD